MRRLTIGVLAAGCLTLLIGTIAVTLPTTGQAREPGYRPSFDDCLNGQLGLGLCPQAGGAKKAMICHFNESDEFGKAKCQEESGGGAEGGYNAHISGEVVQGHNRDYCIRDAADRDACEGKKSGN